jgi:hypothetical protein
MANAKYAEQLRRSVDEWNSWRRECSDIDRISQHIDLSGVDFSGANLRGADLFGVELRGTDFYGADLQGANLQWADLRGSDLRQADLQGAYLYETTLYRANLRGANLVDANLHGAHLVEAELEKVNLRGAHLSEADLKGANLYSANLEKVNMRGARIGRTVFGNIDLRTVQGLDVVQHEAPSTIGLDTIEQSHGCIPEVFLRGAGVSERIIEYLPSLAARAIEFYSCFISYSHVDKSFARRLYDALQGRGIRCWLDEHEMLPGHSIYDEIDRGIRLWDKILLCASEHSLKSWWVDNEIDKAFEKEQQFTKQRGTKIRALIPLNLDNALWQWQDGKANQVRSRLAADFTGWERDNAKFEREFERLVKALRMDEGRALPPASKL